MQESHWNYFLALEEDLENLSRYIELREDNFATYSIETAKILMAASQEDDVLFKTICRHHKAKAERLADYHDLMKKKHPAIFDAEVELVHHGLVSTPYKGWTKTSPPEWWLANNNVKHARDTNFDSASLKNVIDAVSALLLANICSHLIIKGEVNLVPRRDTRLFVPVPSQNPIGAPALADGGRVGRARRRHRSQPPVFASDLAQYHMMAAILFGVFGALGSALRTRGDLVLENLALRQQPYFARYHRSRTHLSLGKDASEPKPVQAPAMGKIVELSEVGGLHHRYERRAA